MVQVTGRDIHKGIVIRAHAEAAVCAIVIWLTPALIVVAAETVAACKGEDGEGNDSGVCGVVRYGEVK